MVGNKGLVASKARTTWGITMSQQFIGELDLQDIDGDQWKLIQPFGYETIAGDAVLAPAGFITDLASIPRLFWDILPKSGKYNRSATIHDWLYRNHMFNNRRKCDDILLEAMAFEGVGWWTRYTIYWNVRMFAQPAWDNETRWTLALRLNNSTQYASLPGGAA